MKGSRLDPEGFVVSPFSDRRVVPPLAEDLTRRGLAPASDEKAIKMSTHVRPETLYAVDRIIEQRLYGIKTRSEFLRLAIQNLVMELLEEIQNGQVQTMIRRYNEQIRSAAEMERLGQVEDMIQTTIRLVKKNLAFDNRFGAILALQNAKRYLEEIPYEGVRRRFELSLYGGDGTSKPTGWEEMLGARLWDKVLEGELDLDDEEQVKERMKVY